MKGEELYFVASDACNILEIKNSSQAIKRLDPVDIGSVVLNDGTDGNPTRTIVNESAMYELVLSSRKKEARQFKRWITHDVLPSIRKQGVYMTDEAANKILDDPDTAVILAEGLLKERKERMEITHKAVLLQDENTALIDDNKELSEAAVLKDNAIYHQKEKIVHLQLSDNYLQKNILPSESLVTSTELGSMIGMSAIAMHKWLRDKKVMRWVNERNILTAKYANEDFTRDTCFTYFHTNGTPGTDRRIMWTEKGVQFVTTLYNLIERKEQPGLFV